MGLLFIRGKTISFFPAEKMKPGHISIPKGHAETSETKEETAFREIKEETNLNVDLDTEFRYVISYSPYNGCVKDVVYFVARVKENGKMTPQECEVSDLVWKNFQEAIEFLTFDSDKQTLESAYNYLKAQH